MLKESRELAQNSNLKNEIVILENVILFIYFLFVLILKLNYMKYY